MVVALGFILASAFAAQSVAASSALEVTSANASNAFQALAVRGRANAAEPRSEGSACPLRDPNGAYECAVEFSTSGSAWSYVAGSVKWVHNAPAAKVAYRTSWVRAWHTDSNACLGSWHLSGSVSSNFPCPADQIWHQFQGVGVESGTGTGAWPWLYTYPCSVANDVTTCTNAVGDSYRYRVLPSGAPNDAAPPTPPLVAWDAYWNDIAKGDYATAYQRLAPGTINLTRAQFVASEQSDRITGVTFLGSVVASSSTTATIKVDFLTTTDAHFGCRMWSGTYAMVREEGRWLIARSDITPQSCTPTAPAKPTAPAPAKPKPSALYVHDFNGNKLAASAARFADPATPASQFESVPGGSRLVAIQLSLTGDGPGTINSDADIDTTLIGTDGQAYAPSFDEIQGCTNFSFGEFTLAPGQSESGCVVFAVPNGVNINRVTFSLTDGAIDTVYWTG